MSFRDLKDKAQFYAFKDVSVETFNAQREFSKPLETWVKLDPVSVMRVIDDQNALGTENTVTHTCMCRKFDHDQYTVVFICGRLYQVQNRVDHKTDRRMFILGLVYMSECVLEDLTRPVFLEDAMQ